MFAGGFVPVKSLRDVQPVYKGGGSRQNTTPSCSKCMKTGHWSYQCRTPPAPYRPRPQRSKDLLERAIGGGTGGPERGRTRKSETPAKEDTVDTVAGILKKRRSKREAEDNSDSSSSSDDSSDASSKSSDSDDSSSDSESGSDSGSSSRSSGRKKSSSRKE
ncbi:hypothetical protein M427DRAFT_70437 [Gonapodya prolifera JEL478]|uniref:CCHC-type domain-containing protein n=1 Tax=Gonapodya prolifera (strain JEL478) TaxID=1344416 RepID=A0A139ADH8_GONPJ|nr:hypothetical protein M427DRAFT_70437 [Gonapodya prolifera JEL478]|eukprot:KXS14644.1 hypothetical protein M427DRAFT_70437 [Gonapodya prolifera JEL478]